MSRYDVASINTQTKVLESMPFATFEQAESHQRRAWAEGRLLVEIIDSPQQFKEWQKQAQEILKRLKEGVD